MDLFSTVQLLSWIVVGAVMVLFALTGGFDFGAGMLALFLGKTDEERRVVINTVGPTWDGNQVWLITAGAGLFAIWPRVYATVFPGFYFALLLVLWCLFLRPVSFEYRSKLESQKWRTFWDWGLFIGSFVPALIIGIGIGNLFLGIPFRYDPITLRMFYGDEPTGYAFIQLFYLLKPFALLVGIVSVTMMMSHGAAYVAMRTEGVVFERAKKALQWSAWVFIITFALAGIWLALGITGYQWVPMTNPMAHPLNNEVIASVGGWMSNYIRYPWMTIFPVCGFVGSIMSILAIRKSQRIKAFVGSCIATFGTIFTMGMSLFPFIVLSSTHPGQSLLVWNASSSVTSLIGILVVAVIMLPIIFVYTAFVYRKMWGRETRLNVKSIQEQQHVLY